MSDCIPPCGIINPHRRGAAFLWVVVVGVAFLISAALIAIFNLGAPPGPVTYKVYMGALAANPATAVTAPTTFTYNVSSKLVTVPYGGGIGHPPLTQTTPVPEASLNVIFTIAIGNATFADGTKSFTAATNAQGNATASVIPVTDGSDTLTFAFQYEVDGPHFYSSNITLTQPDTVPHQIEVDKP